MIFGCLTTSDKYFQLMHIQRKSNILRLYRNQTDTRQSEHALENHSELGKDEQFSGYKTLILFRKLTNMSSYVLVGCHFDSTLPTMVLDQGSLDLNLTNLITPFLVLGNSLIISFGVVCETSSVSSGTITCL